MSSGTHIIHEALKMLTAHSLLAPADNETMTSAMKRLNGIGQRWLSEGINIGITKLEVPGDEFNEPDDATNAIIDNLALELSPGFKDSVPSGLRSNAHVGKNMVEDLYKEIVINPRKPSRLLLKGSGNRQGYNNEVFFGPDSTIED